MHLFLNYNTRYFEFALKNTVCFQVGQDDVNNSIFSLKTVTSIADLLYRTPKLIKKVFFYRLSFTGTNNSLF